MPGRCCTSEKQTGKMGVGNWFATTESFKLQLILEPLLAGVALGCPADDCNGKFELLVPDLSRCGGGGTESINLIGV